MSCALFSLSNANFLKVIFPFSPQVLNSALNAPSACHHERKVTEFVIRRFAAPSSNCWRSRSTNVVEVSTRYRDDDSSMISIESLMASYRRESR